LRTAQVVAGKELLQSQSLGVDAAAPREVAVLCVEVVFNSVFGHT
jgi:hypothetical protein